MRTPYPFRWLNRTYRRVASEVATDRRITRIAEEFKINNYHGLDRSSAKALVKVAQNTCRPESHRVEALNLLRQYTRGIRDINSLDTSRELGWFQHDKVMLACLRDIARLASNNAQNPVNKAALDVFTELMMMREAVIVRGSRQWIVRARLRHIHANKNLDRCVREQAEYLLDARQPNTADLVHMSFRSVGATVIHTLKPFGLSRR